MSCAEFVRDLACEGSCSFTLAHLSEENNRPDIAYETVKSAIEDIEGTVVKVASAYSATEVEIF